MADTKIHVVSEIYKQAAFCLFLQTRVVQLDVRKWRQKS